MSSRRPLGSDASRPASGAGAFLPALSGSPTQMNAEELSAKSTMFKKRRSPQCETNPSKDPGLNGDSLPMEELLKPAITIKVTGPVPRRGGLQLTQ